MPLTEGKSSAGMPIGQWFISILSLTTNRHFSNGFVYVTKANYGRKIKLKFFVCLYGLEAFYENPAIKNQQ